MIYFRLGSLIKMTVHDTLTCEMPYFLLDWRLIMHPIVDYFLSVEGFSFMNFKTVCERSENVEKSKSSRWSHFSVLR